jgi:hypothetical protein
VETDLVRKEAKSRSAIEQSAHFIKLAENSLTQTLGKFRHSGLVVCGIHHILVYFKRRRNGVLIV